MIELIQRLEANGFSYQTSEGVYFDTARFPDYGKFARLNLDQSADIAGRGHYGRDQAQPVRLHAVVSEQAQSPDAVGKSVGRGVSRLAHRMLGHEHEVSGRNVRHPLRRRGSHSRASHQRDRAKRVRHAPPVRALLAARRIPADGQQTVQVRPDQAAAGQAAHRVRAGSGRPGL